MSLPELKADCRPLTAIMSEALDNEQQPRPIQSAPRRRSADEDRAWSQLYAAIYQASAAEEVVKQLDADLQSKRNHLAPVSLR